ncbi:MAG TPA: GntR family transcriptional regulator [Paenibacillus sp.]|nr:GntR family transcriptional regulator [Paenibacillus sp.]
MPRSSREAPMYAQIHDYILDGIRAGRWNAGDRLPSENDLATRFNVSRITIKKAMDRLEEEGVAYRMQGKGSFVADARSGGKPVLYRSPSANADRDGLVALILPRVDNRFTSNLLKGVEAVLDEAGCRVLLCSAHDSPDRERMLLQEAVRLGVGGIIVYPADGERYNEEILRLTLADFPIVVIDRYLKGVETSCVCSDHRGGARQAVTHLLDLGHRRIAFLSTRPEGTTSLEDRLAGYEEALADRGVLPERGNLLFDMSEEAVHAFLRERPDATAVFATHYVIGLRAMAAARRLGRRVPDDLSVVCFDDYEYSDLSVVPPTCVVQQEERIGREAASLALARMRDRALPRSKLVLPTELVVRASTAPPPVR